MNEDELFNEAHRMISGDSGNPINPLKRLSYADRKRLENIKREFELSVD